MAAGPVIQPSGPRVVYPGFQVAYECKDTNDVVPKSHKQHACARAHTHAHTHTHLCVPPHLSVLHFHQQQHDTAATPILT